MSLKDKLEAATGRAEANLRQLIEAQTERRELQAEVKALREQLEIARGWADYCRGYQEAVIQLLGSKVPSMELRK